MEQQNPCIFCSIVSGELKSYKISEEENALAVLEINPISKGHTLIIPKEHKEEFPDLKGLIKKISKVIKERLNPEKVALSPSKIYGHGIINLVPIYRDTNPSAERYQAEQEELDEVQKALAAPTEKKVVKKTEKNKKEEKTENVFLPRTEKIEGKLSLPRRIP